MILFGARVLVIDMERGNHSVGNNASTKPFQALFLSPGVKDQLHLIGPSDVEVLPDYFFKEDASGNRPVKHLGELY